VLADGSIVTTSEDRNPDLFFAIRGGGGNFGVATQFVLRLHPQRATVYAGFLMYPVPLVERVVNVLQDWWPTAREKEAVIASYVMGPDGKVRALTILNAVLSFDSSSAAQVNLHSILQRNSGRGQKTFQGFA
jgi:FAD/FMN-containing dehydrogenase